MTIQPTLPLAAAEPDAFSRFGLNGVAYVKTIASAASSGEPVHEAYRADGTLLASTLTGLIWTRYSAAAAFLVTSALSLAVLIYIGLGVRLVRAQD